MRWSYCCPLGLQHTERCCAVAAVVVVAVAVGGGGDVAVCEVDVSAGAVGAVGVRQHYEAAFAMCQNQSHVA